ncbi:MAG: 16S rRNA (guanine(966)-N(2))-methyltransferase RsmD [Lachnospiraceae bacterium]|nr:16S rRNA (guanine(966)-N(2))-methyltransferase RsmD [Candidatus Darwinimomas equi]
MRVIAGSARRLLLKTLPGNDTRPTTDKIKETLFNMINFDLPGSNFLDLFAGSGAIGIEALSRGSKKCVFIDNNAKATAVIRENLLHTGFESISDVITADVLSALRRMENSGILFDIVFMDPPYRCGLEDSVLNFLKTSKLIDGNSRIIVEMSSDTDAGHFSDMGYQTDRIKIYKTNKHVFLRRNSL